MNRRALLGGLVQSAGTAAAAAIMPVPPVKPEPRVITVHKRVAVQSVIIDGKEAPLDGKLFTRLRAQHTEAATKAMVQLGEGLWYARLREDALIACLTQYAHRYGILPEAMAAFHAIVDPEIERERG